MIGTNAVYCSFLSSNGAFSSAFLLLCTLGRQPSSQPSMQPSRQPSRRPSSHPTLNSSHCNSSAVYSLADNRCLSCPKNSTKPLDRRSQYGQCIRSGYRRLAGTSLSIVCVTCEAGIYAHEKSTFKSHNAEYSSEVYYLQNVYLFLLLITEN